MYAQFRSPELVCAGFMCTRHGTLLGLGECVREERIQIR